MVGIMRRIRLLPPVLVLLVVTPAHAWFGSTHAAFSRAAVGLLPASVPLFFREGAAAIASGSGDPDIMMSAGQTEVSYQERNRHYINLEPIGTTTLPFSRRDYIHLLRRKGLYVSTTGTLPYDVIEWTGRLTVLFALYRKAPGDRYRQQRCLVYAAILAHYAQDLTMPLHTTADYDGRRSRKGKSPKSGIHASVDGIIETLGVAPAAAAGTEKVAAPSSVPGAVMDEMRRSHALVDAVYRMEEQLRSGARTGEITSFTRDRACRAVRFTAELFAAAWEGSAALSVPDWAAGN